MRYIIKRRVSIREGGKLSKMFTAAERPGSMARPMQLNRAPPYGSMPDGAIGCMDPRTVHCPFVTDTERVKASALSEMAHKAEAGEALSSSLP